MNTKTLIYRTATIFVIAMMLFAALPVQTAGATSLGITSIASGTWEATAWPSTLRSGTISVTSGSVNVTGTGTAFLTELSVGNILKTATSIQIGTVASITSDTALTLVNTPTTTRTNISYRAQGVGPADNVTIDNGHTVTVAAKAINQSGTVTVNSGGTLIISNPGAVFSTLSVAGTATGTSGNAFGALTVNNGGLVTAGTNGNYTASSLTINSGGTVNISRAFTVSGATSIAGTISFSSTSVTSRAMIFTGPVTLNSGAVWSEATSGNGANNTYNFQNSFTNNASTFTTSDVTTHTFSGAGKTIGGTTTTSIAKIAMTGSYTNNGTLTAGTILSGAGSLTNAASATLNLGGTASIASLTNAGTLNKTDGGPITTALANFINNGTVNLNGTGTVAGITNNGTVNLTNSGLIAAFNNATASSALNIYDLTVPHFGTLTVSAIGNTVNYAGAGAQTVKPITYSNLIFSGSGAKSITMPSNVSLPGNSILASGTLSIVPTALANVTGNNLGVEQLTLNGSGKAAGTWGSTGSGATNKDDTFFSGSGDLNVINDSRLPQTITFTSIAPTNAAVGGPTYAPTATGGPSGNPVNFTIDPTATSVCSISGGLVSFLSVGTCVIDANQAGDSSYLAATQQQSFDVRNNQTVNFTSSAPVSASVNGPTYSPTATATSGLTVSITVDASAASVCSIDAGVVSFNAIGTCVIDADQAGDADYNAAPQVQQSFSVGKGSQTINFTSSAPGSAVVDGTGYIPSASSTSDLAVTLTIDASASSVCAINAGVVTFQSVGTCVIDANQAGDGNYNAAPQVQQTFAVGKGSQTISFTSNKPVAGSIGGPTYTPTATATSGLAVSITIDASASSICSISGGVVSFLANGTCVIDANQAGNSNYNAASQVQQSFLVTDLPKDSTGVFRPTNGALYLKYRNTTGFADVGINYGIGGDYPVTGDWNGDGTDTIGIYRNGKFYLRNSNTIGVADVTFAFGAPGDQPIAGDWNGDGTDTIGVYRSSTGTFYLRNSNSAGPADAVFQLGIPGDVGIAGDWNGDGVDTTGVFRPSNGYIFLKNQNTTGFADIGLNYGIPGDMPVTGDWNNDGVDTIGVYRKGMFYLRNSNTIGYADMAFALGNPGDMPIAGNWDHIP